MINDKMLEMLERADAIMTDDHFVYTSGLHGSTYINKDALYPNTAIVASLCRTFASAFEKENVQVVAAPAVGGVILSTWTAHQLGRIINKPVQSVYAEKDNGEFILGRGYDEIVKRKRVLVVEDILNTGSSARKVIEIVREAGGKVVGLGAICNRGKVTIKDFGSPPKFVSIINIPMEAWPADKCPLCKAKVPINKKFGKGREFLHRLNKSKRTAALR
jgi:orotate phosphoribosyltransferase